MDWRPVIREAIESNGGLATRRQLLRHVPGLILDGYVGRKHLVRVYPHVYRLRGSADDDMVVLRAALLHAGPDAALSHTTALAVWGHRQLDRPIHLTVDQGIRRAGAADLVVHRRKNFDPDSSQCVTRRGLRITTLARTVIDSWPLLPPAERRPLALDLARRGLVTAKGLDEALAERPNVPGRRTLRQTIDLIADGCQSELEAHGVLNVFRHRSLPPSVGQFRVALPTGSIRLDRAWPEVKLAVELDGARHHTSPEDRQRDLARDAALAALGWVVLRFTFADVLRDAKAVRARVLEVYRTRTAQLAQDGGTQAKDPLPLYPSSGQV
jgi:very-short-patch-repair endonuclease